MCATLVQAQVNLSLRAASRGHSDPQAPPQSNSLTRRRHHRENAGDLASPTARRRHAYTAMAAAKRCRASQLAKTPRGRWPRRRPAAYTSKWRTRTISLLGTTIYVGGIRTVPAAVPAEGFSARRPGSRTEGCCTTSQTATTVTDVPYMLRAHGGPGCANFRATEMSDERYVPSPNRDACAPAGGARVSASSVRGGDLRHHVTQASAPC